MGIVPSSKIERGDETLEFLLFRSEGSLAEPLGSGRRYVPCAH